MARRNESRGTALDVLRKADGVGDFVQPLLRTPENRGDCGGIVRHFAAVGRVRDVFEPVPRRERDLHTCNAARRCDDWLCQRPWRVVQSFRPVELRRKIVFALTWRARGCSRRCESYGDLWIGSLRAVHSKIVFVVCPAMACKPRLYAL